VSRHGSGPGLRLTEEDGSRVLRTPMGVTALAEDAPGCWSARGLLSWEQWRHLAQLILGTADPGRPDPGTAPARGNGSYCRRCDVFTGMAAAGVARPPAEHAMDGEWLAAHCWVCGRSADEIARSPR
jgi:hypothetical protein